MHKKTIQIYQGNKSSALVHMYISVIYFTSKNLFVLTMSPKKTQRTLEKKIDFLRLTLFTVLIIFIF